MSIKIDQFSGIAPKVNPPLLVGNMGVTANNCRVDRGSLQPLKGTTVEATISASARSLFRYKNNWYYWTTEGVDALRSPIANDVWGRVYYTGTGLPKYSYTPHTANVLGGFNLGIPAPTNAPKLGMSIASIKALSSFTDYTATVANAIKIVSRSHGMSGTMAITIVGSMAYSANYTATVIDSNSFYIANAAKSVTSFSDYSATIAGTVKATVTAHGVTGTHEITLSGANYNGTYVAVVIDANSFYFTSVFRTTGTGYVFSSLANESGWMSISTTISSFSNNSSVAAGTTLANSTGHGLVSKTFITISCAADPSYNGTFAVTVVNANSFYFSHVWSSAISAVSDYNATVTGTVKVTAYAHGITSTAQKAITGTTSYDGTYTATAIDGDSFYILHGFVATSTGTLSSTTSAATLVPSGLTGEPKLRYYVYTYVSPLGEEGPPSPASSPINTIDGNTVVLTFETESLTSYNLGSNAFRRVYRTALGTTTSNYEHVGDYPIGTITISDALLDVSLGEIIPSTDWFPPPVGMVGIKMSPNGFMVGYSGNALCASETYLPHAFNPLNQLAFPGQITGIAITGDSIIVFTDEMPYLVTGSSAANLTAVKIDHPQTCTNKNSIVNMGGYILFASPDGLCSVTANELNIATQSYLTREQWQQVYSPSTLRGFFYEGIYIGISDTTAFMFDMREAQAVLTTIDHSTFDFISGYTDLATDKLYLLKATTGEIHSWETGAASTLTWKSKPLRVPKPICPAALRTYSAGSCTVKLYADTNLVHTATVTNDNVVRLPAGYKAKEFQLEITSTVGVDSVAIATSIGEL